MGVARTAIELLPFGTEDDNRAWSRFGGRWRRVRVRYPRGWPPGRGKHPAFAPFLAVLCTIPFALVLLWALCLLVRAVPDLWLRRTANGDLVRVRARQQIFESNSDNPKYWYYLALDDGTRSRIRSWRVRRELYEAHPQGETVTALFTPNLGYVREMRAASPT